MIDHNDSNSTLCKVLCNRVIDMPGSRNFRFQDHKRNGSRVMLDARATAHLHHDLLENAGIFCTKELFVRDLGSFWRHIDHSQLPSAICRPDGIEQRDHDLAAPSFGIIRILSRLINKEELCHGCPVVVVLFLARIRHFDYHRESSGKQCNHRDENRVIDHRDNGGRNVGVVGVSGEECYGWISMVLLVPKHVDNSQKKALPFIGTGDYHNYSKGKGSEAHYAMRVVNRAVEIHFSVCDCMN